jgi:hypothetical protein
MTSKPKPFAALTVSRSDDGHKTIAFDRLDESVHEMSCPWCMLKVVAALRETLQMQEVECHKVIARRLDRLERIVERVEAGDLTSDDARRLARVGKFH